jgi:hypothetical protein
MPPGFDEALLLRPSDIWTKKIRKPRQLKELKWQIRDLIDEKKEKTRN